MRLATGLPANGRNRPPNVRFRLGGLSPPAIGDFPVARPRARRHDRTMTDHMTLRPADAADAGTIRALVREAYAKWVPVIGREPRPMTADYDKAVRDHRIDLLYMDGTLAALIETVGEADCLLIENVAVATAFQGRGLGRHLLAHAEALAAAAGHRRIRLFTNALMAANRRLYARLGYGVDGEEEFPGAIVVHMSKAIG